MALLKTVIPTTDKYPCGEKRRFLAVAGTAI